ncbi:MAG: alpha-galactosidase [Fimbriimonadaceae bacterium]|nr:alpha-galactosidase [Fimbriimonadaceae bacterium]
MLCALAGLIVIAQARQSFPVENINIELTQQGWGEPHRNKSVEGNPLKVGGVQHVQGIGTHADSILAIDLGTPADAFVSGIGVDDEVGKRGSVIFQIWGDGRLLAQSDVMRGGDRADTISANLKGIKRLLLIVTDGGDGIDYDHADWIRPELFLQSPPQRLPKAFSLKDESPMKIAHFVPGKPEIHGPRVVGCSAGKPFLFKVPATGAGKLKYFARGLPEGLALDPLKGVIQGKVDQPARSRVRLKVLSSKGMAERVLIIDSRGTLALTPPMGWNSWNVWGTKVTAKHVRDAARILVKSGLADVGYRHVNIDDAWEGKRAANGEIQTNEKFGDMKSLADEVHGMGLLLGIYSSPGPKTCAGFEASYQHEKQDADTYAKWGIDYLKYDWCSYDQIAKDHSLPELQKPYTLMRDAVRATDRDIVYSLCQYGMGDVWKWGAEVGGNLSRTTGDIFDTYPQMAGIGFSHSDRAEYAGPGHWNDPDMLVVGKLGWGSAPRPTRLTPNEQITHISLWALLAAPLIIGCDLTQLDAFTKDLLMNPEVLDVDQDPLGKAAKRVSQGGFVEVWARPLYDGTVAIGLFNRGYWKSRVTASWKDLALTGPQPVRNLWTRTSAGLSNGSFSATVPAHGALLVKIGRPSKTEFGQ